MDANFTNHLNGVVVKEMQKYIEELEKANVFFQEIITENNIDINKYINQPATEETL